ncbi:MAG: DUF2157 domain-containing protein [Candidatus Solibacter usitatus]|nr:DUF2157 domain-containing protein [Candidatus Solibacter usitatus]
MTSWESWLKRWQDAALIDTELASRIREFENRQTDSGRLRWPAVLALSLGGLLIGAGVILFVSSHWDEISPLSRMVLLLATLLGFHGAAIVLKPKMPILSTVMHFLGTVSLGGGIQLAGQTFNVQEHWPTGILLWAIGAWVGLLLLRDWPQAGLAALLTPAWMVSEWRIPATLLLLALCYASARSSTQDAAWRRVLTWMGMLAVFPVAFWLVFESSSNSLKGRWLADLIALAPAAIFFFWLKRNQIPNVAAAVAWVLLLRLLADDKQMLGAIAWCGLGSAGMIAWGVLEERVERVNLGVAAFAVTVVSFYVSQLMDQLGRSLSLIGLGVLFLLGGWQLEVLRRRLVGRITEVRP